MRLNGFTLTNGVAIFALLTSGWGVALAAAFCPHAGNIKPAAATVKDQSSSTSSCHAKQGHEQDHHYASDQPGAHDSAPHHEPAGATEETGSKHKNIALNSCGESCAHCLGGGAALPMTHAVAGQSSQTRHDTTDAAARVIALLTWPAKSGFAATDGARRHAPPEAFARRHLLISVFLI